MKITTFSPMIICKNYNEMMETFVQLGFAPTHVKADEEGIDVVTTRMKDENGNHVDLVQANVPADMTMIRINVDNFDEAIEMLKSKGFKLYGDDIKHSKTSIDANLIGPNGTLIVLSQHLK